MDKNRFWDIVQRSLAAGNNEDQIEFIDNELEALNAAQIVEFDNIFRSYYEDAYTWDLWAAAYTIQGGCSDDGFADFRAWLVYRGKDVYENAVKNSDSLADLGRETLEESEEAEDFYFLAVDAYEEVTGKDITEDGGYREAELIEEPTGKEWDEENIDQLKTRNPAIFKLFWK